MTAIRLFGILLVGGVKKFPDINHFGSFIANLSKKDKIPARLHFGYINPFRIICPEAELYYDTGSSITI
jgi:hypothetical protein